VKKAKWLNDVENDINKANETTMIMTKRNDQWRMSMKMIIILMIVVLMKWRNDNGND